MDEIRKVAPVESARYVAHLPFSATDLSSALIFARTLVRSLAFLDELDGGETTVTHEDEQDGHHRVFCDRLVASGRRCERRPEHEGACQPRGGLRT
ncbi:hypothetical protein GCM10027280_59920 [Micromonospora polyrhachis]|uniref:Uncharacterized protein n=1 Tax=Micromonospora polyrhachis TaxID=1282883 RepID=A0A7W7SN82_9ACTN|nr:hypothetical protein [Micromonospora polyrhachis]MBB4957908.1 hypothetical protein [Micromonospora polyrhachis]